MRFTAGMDMTEGTILVATADREDLLLAAGGAEVVRVRALTGLGEQLVRAELQLLASLEVAGVRAAPAVLEIEDDGYLREAGNPVGPGSTDGPRAAQGRRRALETAPGTQERQYLARAREDLDALVTALHDRGWVLGASPGDGLAARADGSVTVRDLSGLREEPTSMARLDDRMWVDSVLHDQDRTLRRRIDQHGPGPQLISAQPVRDPQDPPDLAEGAGGAAPAPDPLPAPRRIQARRRQGGMRIRPRGELLLTTATVVLAGLVLGIGGWALQRPDAGAPPPSAHRGPAAAAPDPEAPVSQDDNVPPGSPDAPARRNGPVIEDPGALAAELAAARHLYVTGESETPVAAQGSPAQEQDDAVRAAYAPVTVSGGEPRIHGAGLVEHSASEGTAVLSLETSTAELTTVGQDGTTRSIPATERATVHLQLRWDGSTWWIEAATPVPDAVG